MEFTDNITTYYSIESRHGLFTSAITGLIVLLISIALWFLSQLGTIQRGVAITITIGSLIFAIGSYFAGNSAKKSLPQKIESYQTNATKFIKAEQQKVEAIHKNWTGIRIFWTMFLATGVTILFITSKPIWLGVAIGLLIVGTLAHIEEVISYLHNEKYRLQVNKQFSELQSGTQNRN